MEVQSTDKLFHGHSNELKVIVHICVASGIRTRVWCIGFISSSATGLPPLVNRWKICSIFYRWKVEIGLFNVYSLKKNWQAFFPQIISLTDEVIRSLFSLWDPLKYESLKKNIFVHIKDLRFQSYFFWCKLKSYFNAWYWLVISET